MAPSAGGQARQQPWQRGACLASAAAAPPLLRHPPAPHLLATLFLLSPGVCVWPKHLKGLPFTAEKVTERATLERTINQLKI